MKVTADGWAIFEGGKERLARCVAPEPRFQAAARPHPLHNRGLCWKWFAHVGIGNAYLVRVHPQAGQVDEPAPTRPDSNVHQCKCGTHLEYRVVRASEAVA